MNVCKWNRSLDWWLKQRGRIPISFCALVWQLTACAQRARNCSIYTSHNQRTSHVLRWGFSTAVWGFLFCHFILSTPALLTMYIIAIMLVASHTLNLSYWFMNPVYKLPFMASFIFENCELEMSSPTNGSGIWNTSIIYLYQRHNSSVFVKTSVKVKKGYGVSKTVRFQLSLSDMQWQNFKCFAL